MGRDLLSQPYGRFYYIPRQLSELGHEVELFLFSYRNEEHQQLSEGRLNINSVSLLPNPIRTYKEVYNRIQLFKPDWVIGFSDTYYGILAEHMASRLHAKSLIDAYDNFEAYMPYAKPLHWLWRKALNSADLVTCAGPSIKNLFECYRHNKTTVVIPMSADPVFKCNVTKEECRNKLGLPQDRLLVGYHGSVHRSRDIHCLFRAAEILADTKIDITFVLSGRIQRGIQIPDYCQHLGYLPSEDVPLFLNSLDVLVVTNKPSAFGNYSYPVKLYEAMVSNIPVIASRTQSTEWILANHPECLVDPGNPEELAMKVKQMSVLDSINYQAMPEWPEIALEIEKLMEAEV